jgi:hypothetical protein
MSDDGHVDIMRTLIIKGQNDPMDLDKYGMSVLDWYCGSGDGYLLLLNQEEFPIDIKQTRDPPLRVIARCFAYSFYHKGEFYLKSWEPALRRALQLGLSLTPKVPGKKTALDSLFYYDSSQDSLLLAYEWLSPRRETDT